MMARADTWAGPPGREDPVGLRTEGLGARFRVDLACNPDAGWQEVNKFGQIPTPGPLMPIPAVPDYGDIRSQLTAVDEEDDEVYDVMVKAGDREVWINIDPLKGPMWGLKDRDFIGMKQLGFAGRGRDWQSLTLSERETCLIQISKKIVPLYDRLGKSFARLEKAKEEEGPQMSASEIAAIVKERISNRCQWEMSRQVIMWRTVEIEDVTENHLKQAKGMLYDMEFPWTESGLVQMGPDWLTEAFHKAGTMDKDNRVTKIIMEKKIKVTTGNNGGKFLFEVKYKKPDPTMHTKLFAKIPYPLEGSTRTDRLASSVNKQPQEFYEMNANRLLEATMPCRIPRFYFGDISNDTTNWILITERILFSDRAGQNYGKPKPRKGPMQPFNIEGPYDKCLDYNLRGDPKEYYLLLVRTGAKMAGMYKAGKMGDYGLLQASFATMENRKMEYWGMAFGGNSGEDPRMLRNKVDAGIGLISDTAKVIFPSYCTDETWLERLKSMIAMMNAYTNEINCWKHASPDYVALAHVNMNVDNAYFWRDKKGRLSCGVIDWAGLGSMCLGHKLWWWLYCQDFEGMQENLDTYLEAFVETYQENGGPPLEAKRLKTQFVLTAFQQLIQLFAAVGQIFKMCPKKEWATIEDRYDERINTNVDGKSSLRQYLFCINNIIRLAEEMGGFETLDRWVTEHWGGEFKMPPKTQEMINAPPPGTRL